MKKLIAISFGLLLTALSTAVFADRVFQTSEMLPGSGSDAVGAQGAAWLRRSAERIDGRVMVKVDQANTPYTIWWVIFNNPEECAGWLNTPKDPCALSDLFVEAVEGVVFNASGAISAADGALKRNGKPAGGGVINVDIEVVAGEGAGNGHAGFPPLPALEGILNEGNGLGAEVHIDVNQHANFDTDWITELTTPEGETHRFAIFAAAE
jgi:hypothetical protein